MLIGITGAKGFVGSHLYRELRTLHACEAFDRHKYSLFDVGSMKDFVKDKDLIFHLAGANRASNNELIHVNTMGTLNMLEAIKKYSKQDTKIVLASSLQVYGFTQNCTHLCENNILNPDNIYGLSKLFAEEIIKRYSADFGIGALILRISNIYGTGCKPYYNSVVATFIDLIKKQKTIIINGNGEQARDFIYITDVISAFLKVLNYDFKGSEVVNICTGEPTTVNKIIDTLEKVTGTNINVQFKNTDNKTNYLIGDPSKARNILKYRSKINLETGLCNIINRG